MPDEMLWRQFIWVMGILEGEIHVEGFINISCMQYTIDLVQENLRGKASITVHDRRDWTSSRRIHKINTSAFCIFIIRREGMVNIFLAPMPEAEKAVEAPMCRRNVSSLEAAVPLANGMCAVPLRFQYRWNHCVIPGHGTVVAGILVVAIMKRQPPSHHGRTRWRTFFLRVETSQPYAFPDKAVDDRCAHGAVCESEVVPSNIIGDDVDQMWAAPTSGHDHMKHRRSCDGKQSPD
mmetsp:Transcript_69641/g.186817  ORF Transcript_69641/g.186817 Transcript_69641/m.186817 type:complete len:235 (+) Transcript_69641:1098-1802(+)